MAMIEKIKKAVKGAGKKKAPKKLAKRIADENDELFDRWEIDDSLDRMEGYFGRSFFGFRDSHKEMTPEADAIELTKIRNFVYNLIRIHGVPAPVDVKICTTDMVGGSAAKGVLGGRAQIFLGKEMYEKVDPKERLNVYAGIGIHEAEHLLSSQGFTKWIEERKGILAHPLHENFYEVFEKKGRLNLVEDVRIEIIAVKRSDGFAFYLAATRKAVFEDNLIDVIKQWDGYTDEKTGEEHPPMTPRSKAHAIVMMALRSPQLLTIAMKKFERDGVNPYEFMMDASGQLETWEDVLKLEQLIHSLLDMFGILIKPEEMRKPEGGSGYPSSDTSEGGSESSEGAGKPESGDDSDGGTEEKPSPESEGSDGEGESCGGSPSSTPFTSEEIKAIKEEMKLEEELRRAKTEIAKKEKKYAEKMGRKIEAGSDAKLEHEEEKLKAELKKEIKELKADVEAAEKLRKELGCYGGEEFTKASRIDEMTLADAVEEKIRAGVRSLEEEKFTVEETGYEFGRERAVATVEPKIKGDTDETYKKLKKVCRPHIRKMQRVFSMRLADLERKFRDKREGKLDKRRLALAKTTSRLFCTTERHRAVGLSICLLLDESGSMGYVGDFEGRLCKAEKALTMAFAMQEALLTIPRIDLHIYSHTSYGENNENCLIRRYYSKKRKDRSALAFFGRDCMENYDHKAIETVGKEFLANADHSNKLMLVLSDGMPSGRAYGGHEAKMATKKSVDDIAKKGVHIMQIAIGAANPESMFKHYIKFEDMGSLIPQLSKLLQKMIFGVGRERF